MTPRNVSVPGLVVTLAAILFAGSLVTAEKSGEPLVAPAGPGGARNLTLAPDLSFTDDSSSNFPIRGENLGDGRIASDRPTAIFLGTAHCWNTNREAERFVAVAARQKDAVRFLVVDLDRPSKEQKTLVSRFFHGYIPTLAILDSSGKVVYNRSGETARQRGDTSGLEEILRKASPPVQ
ncbi:MAG TPA: hypothetical protein VKG01_06610 [Thermoanaerobaculia bacterium]|nr:hypothetical protein [Thermoanaerobaculia bacterium]